MNQQEELIHYGSSSIAYSIVKSKRVKTSEIIVDADKVVVRAPFHKPVAEIRDIVQKKVFIYSRLPYSGFLKSCSILLIRCFSFQCMTNLCLYSCSFG